ncbi:hypothetical protein MBLNU457_7123t2 [Dothideomycetes sp. NU457]
MEDLPGADSPPVVDAGPEPEANDDPQDPLRPEIDEEDNTRTPPLAEPNLDMEAVEDEPAVVQNPGDKDNDDDEDSDALSEVDEAQFEDFDPNAIAIDERPRVVDADGVAMLGKHKRKREDGDGEARKKKKEGRREKPKKSRRGGEADVDGLYDTAPDAAKKRGKKTRRSVSPANDDMNLTPEERRKKEFSRKLDEALKKPKAARRKAGIDLEQMADQELDDMRRRMAEAAQNDTVAREQGKPAMHKLKMLPEVVALLNRNTLQSALVDPDINILESVRFFLEPLNDGSLPAYNIQRELFSCLAKLPITKDALVASGIGKVTHFYTRTNKAEPGIKRQAERLVGEWTRPILKRTDDYRKREYETVEYDPTMAPVRSTQGEIKAAKAAAARRAALAVPMASNRATVDRAGVATYTIAPRSDLSRVQGVKRLGASGDEMFRKLKARHQARKGGR